MSEESKGIQFWRSGDWTMVYEDGKLIRAGDHYLADEWLQERFNVTVVDDETGVWRLLAEAEELDGQK